ncbi:MAG: tRNA pseudouridine(55) synthase TruB [Candidatus Saccharibacteria bacterium]|nr:tRNA pseudouridine(55) synthase TruB [Candidatus Saccharibacteria bacterium]
MENQITMEDQIILIDKPSGISSFGVVAKVRGYLRTKFGHKVKVGHTGTLDPFATGLLILLSGKNTKKSPEFLKLDKSYEATLKLGYNSTTGDPEGEITPFSEPISEKPSLAKIESVLHSFLGQITQTPPRFSAIKIGGERAYKLARKGHIFEIPSRTVTIYNIEILDYHYPELTIRCHVSSGTYIRTLAEDIGKKINTGAYLTSLRRISVGDYHVKDATPLSHFTKKPD